MSTRTETVVGVDCDEYLAAVAVVPDAATARRVKELIVGCFESSEDFGEPEGADWTETRAVVVASLTDAQILDLIAPVMNRDETGNYVRRRCLVGAEGTECDEGYEVLCKLPVKHPGLHEGAEIGSDELDGGEVGHGSAAAGAFLTVPQPIEAIPVAPGQVGAFDGESTEGTR